MLNRLREVWEFRDLIYTFVARDLKVRYRGSVLGFLWATFIFLFLLPRGALAYLDPGTGSYIIQIVIASLAGGVYLIAAFRERIKIFLGKLISRLLKRQKDNANK